MKDQTTKEGLPKRFACHRKRKGRERDNRRETNNPGIRDDKKGKGGARICSSLSLGHTRVSNSKPGTSRHGPREQWRSLEILYVSATSPVKGGRKELAELKGTMFNPTLQPPVESFDEV